MKRYLVQRLIGMVFVLWGITIILFSISHLIPGDPVLSYVGDFADEATIQSLREKWGLDKPLPEQYLIYMRGLLQGDLGTSIHSQRPVIEDLRTFFPATFELATAAIFVSITIGVPTGVVSAIRRNRLEDHISRFAALIGVSMPVFWLGLLASALFYYKLGILPGAGRLSPDVDPPVYFTGMYTIDSLITGNWMVLKDSLRHLVLPSLVLGSVGTGTIARLTRSSMLEVLFQDYVRTARAKGLREGVVIVRHALRNALIPTVTTIGLAYGGLLGGAILTETVFSWPGLGRYAVSTIGALDFAAVMGVTLVMTIVYSVANLIVDLAYVYLDPRIQY